jgi:hypothetical protein
MTPVIPGWSERTGPGISRFRVRVFDAPRNDERAANIHSAAAVRGRPT